MTEQQFHLDHWTGEKSWGDLTWQIAEPGKLVQARAELGSYSIELQPDGKNASADIL